MLIIVDSEKEAIQVSNISPYYGIEVEGSSSTGTSTESLPDIMNGEVQNAKVWRDALSVLRRAFCFERESKPNTEKEKME